MSTNALRATPARELEQKERVPRVVLEIRQDDSRSGQLGVGAGPARRSGRRQGRTRSVCDAE